MPDAPWSIVCDHCLSSAVVINPGTNGVKGGPYQAFLLKRPVATRKWCLPCAKLAGWPWLLAEHPVARRRSKPERNAVNV